jgi:hypothetical protein
MRTSVSPVKRKPKVTKSAKAKKGPAEDPARRIARLEKLVDLMLQASLRGRLLPNERRTIKRYLEQRKAETRQEKKKKLRSEGPRCPACRLSIPDEKAERCPHCSVLLAVARKARRAR